MQLPSPTSRLQEQRSIPPVSAQTVQIRQGQADHNGGVDYHCICLRLEGQGCQQVSQDKITRVVAMNE